VSRHLCLSVDRVQYLATKSLDTKRVPRLLSVVQLIGSSTWVIYGLLVGDNFIVTPNAVGAALAIVQMIALTYIHVQRTYLGGVPVKSVEGASTVAPAVPVNETLSQAGHAEVFTAELAKLGQINGKPDRQTPMPLPVFHVPAPMPLSPGTN
jgi:hypothetical protein